MPTSEPDPGYAVFDRVFSPAAMRQVAEELASVSLERTKAGARHVLKTTAVQNLATDSRLLDIAAKFLGTGPIPFRATLFDKSRVANWLVIWHQDTALPLCNPVERKGWGPWSTKSGVLYAHAPARALEQVIALRVNLDDSTIHNGPLRVLPGTHRLGVLTDDAVVDLAKSVQPVDCVTSSGGVVAMRPLIVHASSKSTNGQPRRVVHIEYAATLDLEPGVRLALG